MLDVVLVAVLVAYAVSGYRQGLIVSSLSVVGFLAGGALGMWLGPLLLTSTGWFAGQPTIRVIVLVAGVFVLASLAQGLMAEVGRRARPSRRSGPWRHLDSGLGAVATLLTAVLLIWYAADVVRGAAPEPVAKAVADSKVLQVIDGIVPGQAAGLFSAVRDLATQDGFPRVFDSLGPEPIAPVQPADPAAVTAAVTAVSRASVVKITGDAASCQRGLEGSGWVVATDRVVTNAHVVAGVQHPYVQIDGNGHHYSASVVLFDSHRDLAILDVPGLPAPPVRIGTQLAAGDSAVVVGYPGDGPLTVDAARVRRVITAVGADIYGNPGTSRQVYSLLAIVRPGNSGGPVLDPAGHVVGVVFARSLDDSSTGYALTLDEIRPDISQAAQLSKPVGTGACAA